MVTTQEVADTHVETPHELALGPTETCGHSNSASLTAMEGGMQLLNDMEMGANNQEAVMVEGSEVTRR